MIDLLTLDPATLQASPELDALIAEKWMGWHKEPGFNPWFDKDSSFAHAGGWSSSTNPANAGEARRKAGRWRLELGMHVTPIASDGWDLGIMCVLWPDGSGRGISASCAFPETDGDKALAEALATTRAIVAAMQAAEVKERLQCIDGDGPCKPTRGKDCSGCGG